MTKAIALPTVDEIFASAARGTTTSNVQDLMDNNSVVLQLDVTAKSGTNPTLDVVVYDGPTASGPWSALYTFAQLTDAGNAAAAPTRAPMRYMRAIGTVGGTATPLFTYTLNAVSFKAAGLTVNAGSQGGTAAFTGLTVTSASANAATVGRLGATTPAFQVDASTATSITGIKIKSAGTGGGVAVSAVGETNVALTIDAAGSGTISLNVTGTGNIVLGRAATGVSLAVTGAITSSGATSGIGYATGAGGAVVQATDKSTGVTLNKASGQITMNNAALGAGAEAIFTVTCTQVGANDTVIVNHISAGTAGSYLAQACHLQTGASFDIVVSNVSAGSLSEAIVLQYNIFKGVAA